jgi:hypothetical protein
MEPLPIKKIIFKSFSLPIKEFDNFINIIIVPYVIILPLHLYVIYYDDFILRLFETEGFYQYWRGSLRSQIIQYLFIFPISSCLLANWHRYVFFEGKKPWTYKPLDFSNYTFKFIWKSILVVLVFMLPAVIAGFVFGYVSGSLGLAYKIPGFIPVFILLYLALIIIYFVRVSVILPATAVEQDNTFKKAFQITKNNFWRMFLIYAAWASIVILYLIIFFVFEIYFPTEGHLTRLMLQGVLGSIFMIYSYTYLASCASLIYKHFVQN